MLPAGGIREGTRMTDVSIIIVNWNTRELLLDCIRSLREETRERSMEIIVVDNHSSDGSPGAVRERFPSVEVIENDGNLGFAKANNIGIRRSTGRYVCLVNTDIVALDRCVERLAGYMDRHPEVGALGPRTVDEHGRLRRNCREFPSLRNTLAEALFLDRLFPRSRLFRGRVLHDFDFDATREVDVLSGCFLMVRREALEEVGLMDEAFVATRTEGFESLRETVAAYTPESVEEVTGVPAEDIRDAARLYGGAENASLFFSMGITQHTTGVDNVVSTANLAMLTGNVGREGTGVNPLRGQNNVQGACDMGALPNYLPGYGNVADEATRRRYEESWDVGLPSEVGLTVVEMINACGGDIKAMSDRVLSVPEYEEGASAYVEGDGLRKILSAVYGRRGSAGVVAEDAVDFTVVRNGG